MDNWPVNTQHPVAHADWGGRFSCVLGIVLALFPGSAGASELQFGEALRLALEQNAGMLVQRQQIEAARGKQLQASGQFDWLLSSAVNYQRTFSPDFAQLSEYTELISTGYQVGFSKLLRNGINLGTTLDTLADDSVAGQARQHRAKLDVSLTVPLLKGRESAGVQEQVARLGVLASRYALRDRAAQTLYAALLAYWNYRTRVDLEQVAASSEQRSDNMLSSLQILVDAAERPRADLVLLQADHSDKVAARYAAVLARTEAQKALGRLLGLDAAAIVRLPAPAQPLPDATLLPTGMLPQLEAMSATALLQRADLQAVTLQLEAAQRDLSGAQDNVKPQLNLQLGLGYGKASEGGARYRFIGAPGYTQSQPSVFARLSFQFPLENNVAGGVLKERAALASELSLQRRDLQIGIASDVDSAWQTLSSSAQQLKVAQQALSLYELAVRQESVKQKNGISTLIDVLNVESRFVGARVNLLQLQLAFASALARLRYETGTLLPAFTAADGVADSFALDPDDVAGLGPLSKQFFTSH
ncbi:outer membrane protein [Oxalobacteraceae bacterium GrIS 1.11]